MSSSHTKLIRVKKATVIDLCTRGGTIVEVAIKHEIDGETICRGKHELLEKEQGIPMSNEPDPVSADPKELLKAVEALELENKRLELEVDILTETVKLLKKIRASIPAISATWKRRC